MKTNIDIHTIHIVNQNRIRSRRKWIVVTSILSALTLGLCGAMLMLGHTIYPVRDVIAVLMGENIQGATFAIQTIRLPRMLAGLFVGFAFGVSGYTFQTMLRNPLANPNVIGITSGASAAAIFCIIVLQSSKSVITIAAVLAGLATAFIIYLFSRGKTFSIGRLILVGIGIQAMCNAFITYMMLIGNEHNLSSAIRWIAGSLNGIKMDQLPILWISCFIFVPLICLLGRQLKILELGEEAAVSLGVKTDIVRVILMISAVVLAAIATAITGPIAAIAFLAGPIATRLTGYGTVNTIPAGLVGAVLVLGADLIGQFAFKTKYPVGVLTGIIGSAYLLFLLVKMNRRGDF